MIFMRLKAFFQGGATPLFGTYSLNCVQGSTCDQAGKNLLKYWVGNWLGIEPGPQGEQTVSYPAELSWPGATGRTDSGLSH